MQIRKHPEEGLNVKHNGENKFINITQLADDTTLFLKNEEAILKALKIVENFWFSIRTKIEYRKNRR